MGIKQVFVTISHKRAPPLGGSPEVLARACDWSVQTWEQAKWQHFHVEMALLQARPLRKPRDFLKLSVVLNRQNSVFPFSPLLSLSSPWRSYCLLLSP